MNLKKIAEFAKNKVGCGYIYGATGWVCSPQRREQQAKQYPDQAAMIMGTGAKWDGKQCFDCAQLTRFAAKEAGLTIPSGATSQWKADVWAAKGEINSMPDEAGILLYRQVAGGVMQHIGVYIGGGETVDARGTKDGVLRSALTKYPWTHWARPDVKKKDGKETKPVNKQMVVTRIDGAKGSTVNFRATPANDSRVIATIPFGSVVNVTSEQGEWSGFVHDGKPGWMQSRFLADPGSSPAPDVNGDTVTVNRAELTAVYQKLGQMIGE